MKRVFTDEIKEREIEHTPKKMVITTTKVITVPEGVNLVLPECK